ncbi:MAG: hypothetical protein RLZZ127_2377 [Planctomycetota bacterium]|jgi:hypothetical protein
MTAHAALKSEVLLAIGARPDVRLFNNPVGEAWTGVARQVEPGLVVIRHPARVAYGLAPGSCDLVGWRSVVVTPDMVGRRLAVFLGAEVKTGRGVPTLAQVAFMNAVTAAGGLAAVVRSVDDARALVDEVRT